LLSHGLLDLRSVGLSGRQSFPTALFFGASVARLCRAERGGPGFASGSEPDPVKIQGRGRRPRV